VKDALNSQTFRDFDEHRSIVDKDYLRSLYLVYVQSKSKNIRVGLAHVYEARGNEAIDEPVQIEFLNSICIQFSPLVADYGYLHPQLELKLRNQRDHLRDRFRLRKHEALKLITGERPLFVEDHET
jgi:hypothetical protein